MSNPKTTDPKMKTIVFRRTTEFELEFDEWYDNKKDDFKTEADALVQWSAMCDNTDKPVDVENDDEGFGWEQVEEQCDEIQDEYQTDYYDDEMTDVIEKMEETFEAIGVKFLKDHSCCLTCGHAEAEVKNYVFYHAQDTEQLRKGERSVHLAFNLDDEHKKKVLEMIAVHTEWLHWSGKEHTKIFLTCDADEMATHIKDDADRQVHMKKLIAEKEARRAELIKQLAELDK